jgi:hypothetical protein
MIDREIRLAEKTLTYPLNRQAVAQAVARYGNRQ